MLLNKKVFYKIYLAGIFLIVLLPILALPPVFHPADWAKSTVFRIIFSVLLFFFLTQLLCQENYKQEIAQKFKAVPKQLLWPFLAFAGLVAVSTIFALEPYFSFWGSPYRGGGALNLLLYMAFALFAYIVVEKKDWDKIWNMAIVGGLAVSFVAIAQQFGLFSENLVKYPFRPPSTMGNTNFLAEYLLLLLYLPLMLGFKAESLKKKIFYFASSAVFLFVIAITISKAAYIAFFLGILWLGFSLKFQQAIWNKFKWLIIGLPVLAAVALMVFVNTPGLSSSITEKNKFLGDFLARFELKKLTEDARFSSWMVGIEALKDRPLLGYGMENFSIGYDKYYNPDLPGLSTITGGQWWDRAHNFLLDIGVTFGIPALLIYLFFWGALFFRLKNFPFLQAAIISYFTNIFFGFDCVPTYITSFMIAGYSMHLLSLPEIKQENSLISIKTEVNGKNIILALLLTFLIFFVWQYNVLPIKVNTAINWANFYNERDKTCDRAALALKPYLESHTIASSFLYQTYGKIIIRCLKESTKGEERIAIAKEGIKMDQKLVKERPYFVRSWIYLGSLESFLLEQDPENKDLQEQMNFYFSKAAELSPRRANTYTDWSAAHLSYWNCSKALEVAEKCKIANANFSNCWWFLALANVCLKNQSLAEEQIEIAKEKGYDTVGNESLKQLSKIYTKLAETEKDSLKYYRLLKDAYYWLSARDPGDLQAHASLAYVYRILSDYDKARKEALIVLSLSAEAKKEVEAFLKTLPYPYSVIK